MLGLYVKNMKFDESQGVLGGFTCQIIYLKVAFLSVQLKVLMGTNLNGRNKTS